MKDLPKTWVIGMVFFAVLAGTWLIFPHKRNSSNSISMTGALDEKGWVAYENTKFHYEINYPTSGSVARIIEEEPVSEKESMEVKVGGDGYSIIIKVNPAQLPEYASSTPDYAHIVRLSPKAFAEYGLQAEADYLRNNPTPYNNKLQPSGLLTAVIGGRTAYGFRINGFSEVWPLGGFEGPALDAINNYFVVADGEGNKFVIAYPADDPISQQIVDSFRFTGAITSENQGQ